MSWVRWAVGLTYVLPLPAAAQNSSALWPPAWPSPQEAQRHAPQQAPQQAQQQAPQQVPAQVQQPVPQQAQPKTPQQSQQWARLPRMQLERQFAGPLQDTVIQRWSDPADGTVCYLYLPIAVQHSAPTELGGFVQYGGNAVGSISCFARPTVAPARAR